MGLNTEMVGLQYLQNDLPPMYQFQTVFVTHNLRGCAPIRQNGSICHIDKR